MWSGILRLRCPFCVRSTWEWESHVPRVLLYVFGHRADTQALSSIASLPPSFSPFTQVASHWRKRWYHSLRGVAGPVHSLRLCMLHCACVPCCLYLFSLFYCWDCSCLNLQGSCQIYFLRKFCILCVSLTILFLSWWFSPQNSPLSPYQKCCWDLEISLDSVNDLMCSRNLNHLYWIGWIICLVLLTLKESGSH